MRKEEKLIPGELYELKNKLFQSFGKMIFIEEERSIFRFAEFASFFKSGKLEGNRYMVYDVKKEESSIDENDVIVGGFQVYCINDKSESSEDLDKYSKINKIVNSTISKN